MGQEQTLTRSFEAHRDHLRSVAYRMLGSEGEAEDAVQEAWLRLSRSQPEAIDNLRAWLTTVVARVCLDVLRSRSKRHEEPLTVVEAEPDDAATADAGLLLADSMGVALLVVLETLAPAERVAFVLHDLFEVPFDEVAAIVGRSVDATRQLASRARRRVRGASTGSDPDPERQREVVDAFLRASRTGDFEALLAVLDPEVEVRADETAVRAAKAAREQGAPEIVPQLRGARNVAAMFKGRAKVARLALVDGSAGAAIAPGGQPRVVFKFTLAGRRITAIELLAEPARIAQMKVAFLQAP